MSNFINPATNTTPIISNTTAAPIGTAPLAARPVAPVMSGAPILSNTATPLAGAPLTPGATTTMLPATGMGHHNDRHLSRKERKALKRQNKALKHQHGHGLTGTGMPLMGGAGTGLMRGGATNVVEHQPIVEREVIVERAVEVRREHHVQPVIHERQHQIQPIIRTEVTNERRDLVNDHSVMMPAVVEQPRLATTTGMTTADQRGIMPGTTNTTGMHHATIGQKIKGTVKEVQGSLTHNPMKKEEGRLLKQGIEPATVGMSGMGTTPGTLGTTGTATRF